MFVQTFLDFVSQKALSIVIADGCECMQCIKCFKLDENGQMFSPFSCILK